MVAQTTNGSGIEHWLKEEMALWHALPLFVAMALVFWGSIEVVNMVVNTGYGGTEMIGAAGMFAGMAMGWTARRQHEAE